MINDVGTPPLGRRGRAYSQRTQRTRMSACSARRAWSRDRAPGRSSTADARSTSRPGRHGGRGGTRERDRSGASERQHRVRTHGSQSVRGDAAEVVRELVLAVGRLRERRRRCVRDDAHATSAGRVRADEDREPPRWSPTRTMHRYLERANEGVGESAHTSGCARGASARAVRGIELRQRPRHRAQMCRQSKGGAGAGERRPPVPAIFHLRAVRSDRVARARAEPRAFDLPLLGSQAVLARAPSQIAREHDMAPRPDAVRDATPARASAGAGVHGNRVRTDSAAFFWRDTLKINAPRRVQSRLSPPVASPRRGVPPRGRALPSPSARASSRAPRHACVRGVQEPGRACSPSERRLRAELPPESRACVDRQVGRSRTRTRRGRVPESASPRRAGTPSPTTS